MQIDTCTLTYVLPYIRTSDVHIRTYTRHTYIHLYTHAYIHAGGVQLPVIEQNTFAFDYVPPVSIIYVYVYIYFLLNDSAGRIH